MQEALLALLTTLPFESFEEREDCLIAYLPVSTSTETLALEIEHLRGKIPFTFKAELMEDRNWNVLWESNFSPIQVGSFCGIRAEFHPSFGDAVQYELCIQPRMAFGTGHHETTYMMIELMEQLPLKGRPGARLWSRHRHFGYPGRKTGRRCHRCPGDRIHRL
ncbi:MAG: 50S ribosomal protein L11 methyltransferase [Saprospirales bacterium]|nr:50S ribosomal protein L11 methyltransferase [Saprospirales bacterium]